MNIPPATPLSDEEFYGVAWLRELCDRAGKGTLDNVDARAVRRTIDGLLATIAHLRQPVADEVIAGIQARHEINSTKMAYELREDPWARAMHRDIAVVLQALQSRPAPVVTLPTRQALALIILNPDYPLTLEMGCRNESWRECLHKADMVLALLNRSAEV